MPSLVATFKIALSQGLNPTKMHSHLATNPPLDAALLRHQHRATPKARIVCRANGKPPEPGEGKEKDKDKLKSKFALNIDPVNLGRKSRQLFDDVWNQFAKITSPTSSFSEDQLGEFADSTLDYQTPQANFTTVLVLGSTGTVGTVMVRKLLLRGYIVKVMVRNEEAAKAELPPAVEIFQGDLTSYKDCQQSVQGVDKVSGTRKYTQMEFFFSVCVLQCCRGAQREM